MHRNLIFDIGAFRGEDAEFYLAKGFQVLSVEANPEFATLAIERNRQAYLAGAYRMEACAIAEAAGEIDFYVHSHGDWSSAYKSDRFSAGAYKPIRVPAMPAGQLFQRYGVPYYVKIDIEGTDAMVLDAICTLEEKPPFLSYELGPRTEYAAFRLAKAGYTRFKLVEQGRLGALRLPRPAREGEEIDYRFTGHHSGPFGEETPGQWLSLSELNESLAARPKGPQHWYDVHAALPGPEGRLQQANGRPLNPKRATIARLVPGKTFADVGGLWGLNNEMASVALKAGARSAAMIDIVPLENGEWRRFRQKLREAGVPEAACICADACAPDFPERAGVYDIVHSAGVIYHVPSPYAYLMNLCRIAREHLMISSMTVPDRIEIAGEVLDLSGGRFLSTHRLEPAQRRILTAHFSRLGIDGEAMFARAETLLKADGQPDHGPWWWLFTVESLCRMLSAVRLNVVSVAETWPGRAHTFLCTPEGRQQEP